MRLPSMGYLRQTLKIHMQMQALRPRSVLRMLYYRSALEGKLSSLLQLGFEERDLRCFDREALDSITHISKKLSSFRSLGLGYMNFAILELLYVLVRFARPGVVVETGVASGASTYVILDAMDNNGSGRLYSIDHPKDPHGVVVPHGREVGWLVPHDLRSRWKLLLGKSEEVLPNLLRSVGKVDLFIHDSSHTYNTMMFEFRTVWPHLATGGILLADDVTLPSARGAFEEFTQQVGSAYWGHFSRMGITRK